MKKDILKKGREFINQAEKEGHSIFMIIENQKDRSFGILSQDITKNCMLNFMYNEVITDSDIRIRIENLIEDLKNEDSIKEWRDKFEANRVDLDSIL